jgi:hypothetical protein
MTPNITRREYFAAMAMQALINAGMLQTMPEQRVAKRAWYLADIMEQEEPSATPRVAAEAA